ncbi:hypothetical protein [Endozoicomonas sp. 4G]|uniref:hypothetical protein n=1 Tax=Endozoicomonas sp. 4G TaxID=2872754 RepID=UPI0020786F5A|nr:hypothetical protein [Endozoicomonas sp. 4G]
MIPTKTADFLRKLRQKTESGDISWSYDDENATVKTELAKLAVIISYTFDSIEEVGVFRVQIIDKPTNREAQFSTSQEYDDFKLVKSVYDSAQSSDFNFDF